MDMKEDLMKLQMDAYDRGMRDSRKAVGKSIVMLREAGIDSEMIIKAIERYFEKENMKEKT